MSELTDAEKVTLLNSQVVRLQESVNGKNQKISELEAIIK